ncbi:MAG: hypothetical protein HYR72_27125 [Deltaproteobacteria bacterium]|nr:hypothetical protein [Deltaproteobacteria bacterium]MBI3390312.1 hypothetical protein [Deltaproteobacteria bacterium]
MIHLIDDPITNEVANLIHYARELLGEDLGPEGITRLYRDLGMDWEVANALVVENVSPTPLLTFPPCLPPSWRCFVARVAQLVHETTAPPYGFQFDTRKGNYVAYLNPHLQHSQWPRALLSAWFTVVIAPLFYEQYPDDPGNGIVHFDAAREWFVAAVLRERLLRRLVLSDPDRMRVLATEDAALSFFKVENLNFAEQNAHSSPELLAGIYAYVHKCELAVGRSCVGTREVSAELYDFCAHRPDQDTLLVLVATHHQTVNPFLTLLPWQFEA